MRSNLSTPAAYVVGLAIFVFYAITGPQAHGSQPYSPQLIDQFTFTTISTVYGPDAELVGPVDPLGPQPGPQPAAEFVDLQLMDFTAPGSQPVDPQMVPTIPAPEPEPAAVADAPIDQAPAASAASQPVVVEPTAAAAESTASQPQPIYQWLTAAGWPDHLLVAAASVAWCESRYRPGDIGDHGKAYGLFQIHQHQNPDGSVAWGWWQYFDLISYWLDGLWADPVHNAKVAYMIYQYDIDRGYAPWTQWTCKP